SAAMLERHQITRFCLLTQLAKLGSDEAATASLELVASFDPAIDHARTRANMVAAGVNEGVIKRVERKHQEGLSWNRVCMLADTLPFAPNQADVLQAVRHRILERLADLRHRTRSVVLFIIFTDNVFDVPVLSRDQLEKVSAEIRTIYNDWHWP